MTDRRIAIAALVLAAVVGVLLVLHARPNPLGLPHGMTQ